MKKRIMIAISALIGIVLLIYGIFIKIKGSASIAIIGGADGPTSVFVVGKVPAVFSVAMIIVGLVLLVLAVILLNKKQHL